MYGLEVQPTDKVIIMLTITNNQAQYLITVKNQHKSHQSIPYATRARAASFIERMAEMFPQYTTLIMTDIEQVAGVRVQFSQAVTTYMIKAA